jgi:hypothetical protein
MVSREGVIMPTWEEVRAYARSNYTLAEDEDEHFSIVWEYDDERKQAVRVSHFLALDREWVDFASAACAHDELSAAEALKRNFDFALGALCLDGDVYVVRHSAQLETMDLEEFELPLRVVASTADSIEAEVGRKDDF